MTDRKATSIRLSAEADRLLDELNERLGAKSRSAVLELAIRDLADRRLHKPTTDPLGAALIIAAQRAILSHEIEQAIRSQDDGYTKHAINALISALRSVEKMLHAHIEQQ